MIPDITVKRKTLNAANAKRGSEEPNIPILEPEKR
jgi:hypothetical protein